MGIGKYNNNYHKPATLTPYEQAQQYMREKQARRQAQLAKSKSKQGRKGG